MANNPSALKEIIEILDIFSASKKLDFQIEQRLEDGGFGQYDTPFDEALDKYGFKHVMMQTQKEKETQNDFKTFWYSGNDMQLHYRINKAYVIVEQKISLLHPLLEREAEEIDLPDLRAIYNTYSNLNRLFKICEKKQKHAGNVFRHLIDDPSFELKDHSRESGIRNIEKYTFKLGDLTLKIEDENVFGEKPFDNLAPDKQKYSFGIRHPLLKEVLNGYYQFYEK